MNYQSIIEEFINKFPEIEEESQKELSKKWHEEQQLPDVFFGNVLNLILVKELKTMKNYKLLDRLFNFLELMAISGDESIKGILTATILEYLGDDKQILKKARSLMGKETLRLSHEVEKSWGRE
jgi:hypothetical protein